MRQLYTIGDEIHFDGQVIAIIVNNAVGGTVMGKFLDFIADQIGECDTSDAELSEPFIRSVEEAARKKATGGLLRLADLQVILDGLR